MKKNICKRNICITSNKMMPFLISHSNTTRNKCLTRPNKSYHVQKCWHFRHFPTIMYVLCICKLYVLVYVCTSGSNWKPEPDISVNFVMLWHLINTRLHVPNCLTSFDVKPKEITQPSGFLKAFEFEIRENQCVAQTNSYLFQLIHSIPFMKVSNCFGLRCVCGCVSVHVSANIFNEIYFPGAQTINITRKVENWKRKSWHEPRHMHKTPKLYSRVGYLFPFCYGS